MTARDRMMSFGGIVLTSRYHSRILTPHKLGGNELKCLQKSRNSPQADRRSILIHRFGETLHNVLREKAYPATPKPRWRLLGLPVSPFFLSVSEFGLSTVSASRPAGDHCCRAQTPSMPRTCAPEGLGIDSGEHGGMIARAWGERPRGPPYARHRRSAKLLAPDTFALRPG